MRESFLVDHSCLTELFEGEGKLTRLTLAVWLLTVTLVLSTSPTANAQAVANAQIQGVISDATGAAVPGAQVKATQTDTARVATTVSGADGSYVLPNLPVGPYRLEVTSPAF